MTALALDRARLPVAPCPACGREGLVWLDVGEDGVEVRRCLSCAAPVDVAAIAPVGVRRAEALGYTFLDRTRKSSKFQKLSGCGAAGVKSCGTGGCSSGGCSSGGCSSGGCSTR